MKQLITFRAWTAKASLEIEIPDDTEERFRMRAAVEIAWKTRKTRADLRGADLRGADLRGAVLRDADLTGADLTGAVLRDSVLRDAVLTGAVLTGAVLRDADLTGADLTGAVLRDADLRGADLRDAVLRDADLTGAVLRDADLTGVPVVPDLDRQILVAVEAVPESFNMGGWHNACGTSHCRAGWAITLAGEAGKALEAKVGPAIAGTLIYHASVPELPIPNFYTDNETALADMRARVAALDAEKAEGK